MASSNEKNNRTLGGTSKSIDIDDDKEDNSYEVQMEKIMARFTNFNQILIQNPTNDDDDDDDDQTQDEKDEGHDEDDEPHSK